MDLNILVTSNSSECDVPEKFKEYVRALSSDNKNIKNKIVSDEFMKSLNKQENQDKRVFDILLETYDDIKFEKIDFQVKEFIESEREALNLKFKDMQ